MERKVQLLNLPDQPWGWEVKEDLEEGGGYTGKRGGDDKSTRGRGWGGQRSQGKGKKKKRGRNREESQSSLEKGRRRSTQKALWEKQLSKEGLIGAWRGVEGRREGIPEGSNVFQEKIFARLTANKEGGKGELGGAKECGNLNLERAQRKQKGSRGGKEEGCWGGKKTRTSGLKGEDSRRKNPRKGNPSIRGTSISLKNLTERRGVGERGGGQPSLVGKKRGRGREGIGNGRTGFGVTERQLGKECGSGSFHWLGGFGKGRRERLAKKGGNHGTLRIRKRTE